MAGRARVLLILPLLLECSTPSQVIPNWWMRAIGARASNHKPRPYPYPQNIQPKILSKSVSDYIQLVYRVSELELVFFFQETVSYDANKFGKVMVPDVNVFISMRYLVILKKYIPSFSVPVNIDCILNVSGVSKIT